MPKRNAIGTQSRAQRLKNWQTVTTHGYHIRRCRGGGSPIIIRIELSEDGWAFFTGSYQKNPAAKRDVAALSNLLYDNRGSESIALLPLAVCATAFPAASSGCHQISPSYTTMFHATAVDTWM